MHSCNIQPSAVIIGLDMETYTVMEGGSVNVTVAVDVSSLTDGVSVDFTVTLTVSGTAGELQCKSQYHIASVLCGTCTVQTRDKVYEALPRSSLALTAVAPCLNRGSASFRPRLRLVQTAVGPRLDRVRCYSKRVHVLRETRSFAPLAGT